MNLIFFLYLILILFDFFLQMYTIFLDRESIFLTFIKFNKILYKRKKNMNNRLMFLSISILDFKSNFY